jgi:hypothetical protein
MKTLMIAVVQKSYEFIRELFDDEKGGELLLKLAARDPLLRWESPAGQGEGSALQQAELDLIKELGSEAVGPDSIW